MRLVFSGYRKTTSIANRIDCPLRPTFLPGLVLVRVDNGLSTRDADYSSLRKKSLAQISNGQ